MTEMQEGDSPHSVIKSPNIFLMFDWQTLLLTIVAALTIPLYIRILYVLLRHRSKHRFYSHFYTITISQWSYMQTYLFEYARIIGVVLISIQRCSTVSYPHTRFNHHLIRLPPWVFFAVQYITPIFLCANMFFVPMRFNEQSTLNVVISKEVLKGHYLKSALIPLIAIIICSIAYGAILRTLRDHSIHTRRKDVRMSVQVIGLLIALIITCIHFCMQFYFNYQEMVDWVYFMRYFTPLWVGLLTFINPWMIIIMNAELRHLVLGRHAVPEASTIHPVIRSSMTGRKSQH
ncbi:unnamed protein product [Cylicocyclus nassatus]|uniref:Serpentine receptor class gamma n=1 Tax=Cylicocyclus nassatus TaxID=53992 RepID=A0AA36GY48_CYLNA|nr:unnamed protein product [Cylicocyclus nassatus]